MKICSGMILFFVLVGFGYSLSLSDFVPSFLYSPKNESMDASVKPFIEVKRNASSTSTWYCTRMQNNVSNVFCDEESAGVARKIVYGNKNDNTQVVDNAVATNGTLTQSINQRTTTFQDPKVTNLLIREQGQIQNSASIPLQPSENVHMDVNAEQVQFNIQY